jgi:hypothetical protein
MTDLEGQVEHVDRQVPELRMLVGLGLVLLLVFVGVMIGAVSLLREVRRRLDAQADDVADAGRHAREEFARRAAQLERRRLRCGTGETRPPAAS